MKRNSTELKVKYHGDKDKPVRKKNPNLASVSKLGYRDDSPYRSLPYIDIDTPSGRIDMSNTGIPLWANGRILPPYSGIHQFDTTQVKEIPLARQGGWLKEFQTKGQVNLTQAALNQANSSFQPTTTAVRKPVISPVPLANQPFPINVKIDDPRKIHPVTGLEMNPNRDYKSGNYKGFVIKKIIDEGKKLGFNKNQVLDNIAIALQESGLGQYDNQIGHALHGDPITGMMNGVQVLPDLGDVQLRDIDAAIRNQYLNYKYNTQMINKNPKSDAELLQWYNTPYPKKGQLNTGTEKEYHTNTGRSTKRFYGVDVTKTPLQAATLPYGKTIVSLRDSLIAPNADIQMMLKQAGYKKTGGSQLPMYQVPPGQFKVQASERDSVKNMAYKTMQYEKERGSAAGTGLSDFGNPKLPAGANINQAVDWYMDNIYPQLGAYSTAMEKAEAGDFLYNSGKDARSYAIQEYFRKTDPQNKTGWQDASGNWKDRKDPSKWDAPWSEIQKLPTNDRRVFINKGRDWYYQNINNPSPGVPSDAYGNTWYGRIWNTNDYVPYNPNNPKFTPKQKSGGSKLPSHLPEAYKTGGWLKEFQGTEGGSEVFRPQLKPMVDAFNREQQEQKRKLQQSISYQTQPMVAESTDTPSVKTQQQQQVFAEERWNKNKPVSKTEVTPEKYSKKIAEYATKEDKEVLDKYYKKYDKATQDEVKAIQAELVANNFLPNAAAIDGKFGDKTKSAYLKYKATQRVGDLSGETNKSSCSYDGCAEYVSSVTRPYGWVIGDAWEMKNNIESNGGNIKYNIYEDSRFSNVKNVQQLKNVTEQVKKNNKASSEMFQIGDVVGLYNKSSNMHPTALKDGRGTYNTHVGVVTDIKDGKPIISHNIHGKLHHDAFDNLSIGWIGSPASKIGQYKPKKQPDTLDEKINVYSKDLTEILAPGLNSKNISENIKGILRLETGLGKNKPSDSDISKIKLQRFILGEPTEESKISRGIGKLKTAGLPDEIRYFLDIKDDDVSDDAGIKGAIYKYIDAYSRFKKYSENNPQLHLTDDDIHNMSILAYNQGTGKLMNLGYNNPNMSIDEEVAKLRSLYRGNVKDISSTNYRYLPETIGQTLYDMEYPEGHPTYISRVNKYAVTPFEQLMNSVVENKKPEGVTALDKRKKGGWLKEFQGTEGTSQTGPVGTVNLPPVDIVGKKMPWYEKVGKYLQERTPGLMVRDLLHNYARNFYAGQPWEKAPLRGPKAKEFEEGMAQDRKIKRLQKEDPEGYSVWPWYSPDYWAQNLAEDTRMLGKKLQVFPDYDSELEPWINPMAFVGAMAEPIGQAPAQAQALYDQGYTIPEAAIPVALSFLNPLVIGKIPMGKSGILPAAELTVGNLGAQEWLDQRGKIINKDFQIEKRKGGSKLKGWLHNV